MKHTDEVTVELDIAVIVKADCGCFVKLYFDAEEDGWVDRDVEYCGNETAHLKNSMKTGDVWWWKRLAPSGAPNLFFQNAVKIATPIAKKAIEALKNNPELSQY